MRRIPGMRRRCANYRAFSASRPAAREYGRSARASAADLLVSANQARHCRFGRLRLAEPLPAYGARPAAPLGGNAVADDIREMQLGVFENGNNSISNDTQRCCE